MQHAIQRPIRRLCCDGTAAEDERWLTREWLVTNGLGGYASGTVSGVATRRYHGLLVSALPGALGRTLLLTHLSEQVRLANGTTARFGGEELMGGKLHLYGADYLSEFRLEMGTPIWQYRVGDCLIEKRIFMPHEQNTVYVTYRLLSGTGPVRLKLLPGVHFRSHDAPVNTPLPEPFRITASREQYELSAHADIPPLRMKILGERPALTIEGKKIPELLFRVEHSRGYESSGTVWSPGYFRVDLSEGTPATLVASTEDWSCLAAMTPEETWETEWRRRERLLSWAAPAAHGGAGAELVLAADQFLVKPAGRVEDAMRAHAAGDDVRTVIAGYHWFTDWGRDTMISLEGLTLTTGRHTEAGYLLRTFGQYVRDGLIPNLFPEGESTGLYHTADATLWFFHALDRYLHYTHDRQTLNVLLPKLIEVGERHLEGTRFGIGVDPRDGLLRQGAEGYQLTWMDAKVGDWVVTPRRGKAVELNALWYNALRLLEHWVHEVKGERQAERWAACAEQTRRSFNQRFWYADGGYLYDVVDGEEGDDTACRPNQVLAIALPHPVLEEIHWQAVLDVVEQRLLTPVGLRSLSQDHPDYKSVYSGDIRARDAAYHQGTVWAWLIGPFIDAWLKLHPDQPARAREFLNGCVQHLGEAGIGSISEIFDADEPYHPRGCIAQAWSIAEALRCWVKTAPPASGDPSVPSEADVEPSRAS